MNRYQSHAQGLIQKHQADEAGKIIDDSIAHTHEVRLKKMPVGNPAKNIPPLYTAQELLKVHKFWLRVKQEYLKLVKPNETATQ